MKSNNIKAVFNLKYEGITRDVKLLIILLITLAFTSASHATTYVQAKNNTWVVADIANQGTRQRTPRSNPIATSICLNARWYPAGNTIMPRMPIGIGVLILPTNISPQAKSSKIQPVL